MKKQINDLLLKMQKGENCIGETANQLNDLLINNTRQQNIEVIAVLSEVVKANNKLLGSERTMNDANDKIKELIKEL